MWGYDSGTCTTLVDLYLERGSPMDIGEERKVVEFEPLKTDTPAPVEPAIPAPSTPVETPAEEPVGV